MTDFGTANDAVAICKAVIIGIAPDARIMDITHQVTPYSIEEGCAISGRRDAVLSGGNGFPGGGGSRRGDVAQSRDREIEEGAIFRGPGQRLDHAGRGSRRDGGRARNHESRVDDRRQSFVHFSWARYFFACGRASGGGGRLDHGGPAVKDSGAAEPARGDDGRQGNHRRK